MDPRGRVAIVTGASRGIGRLIAMELAARGASVVVAARTVEPRRTLPGTIGETIAAIRNAGGRAEAVRTDVRDPADLERLVDTTVDTYGRLDILVNNAAETAGESASISEHTREGWLRQFDSNVHAPFTLIGRSVPHLRAQGGGVIVNVTSGAADLVEPVLGPPVDQFDRLGPLLGYATTKAALNRMTNVLAQQLAPDNIAVVAVDPGYTRTERVALLGERGLIEADGAHPMDVPVALVLKVITADDPLEYSGRIVRVG